MSRPSSRRAYRAVWRLHRAAWRLSGGRVGSRAVGLPVLELVTVGHRSGVRRSVLLSYLSTPDGPAVVGTNAGADADPAWAANLKASPDAEVREAGRWRRVRARLVDGEEFEHRFAELVRAHPGYADYREMTDRAIPIFVLEPTGERRPLPPSGRHPPSV